MKNWTFICITICLVCICAYLSIKTICLSIEINSAYKYPMVKYNRTIKNNSTTVLLSKVDVHFDKADKLQLLADGSYIAFNPINISFSNTTNSTVISNSTTTENGTSKPILPTQSLHDWIVAINYTHLDKQADIQSLTCYKHIIWGLYAGLGIYTRMDMFAEDYTPKYNWQNITVGIAYIF